MSASRAPADNSRATERAPRVGAAHAPEERAAERFAETLLKPQPGRSVDCPLCGGSATPCPACAAGKRQLGRSLQPRPAGLPPSVDKALAAPGQHLPDGVRDKFQRRLGADLSALRLHSGPAAAQAAQAVSARAFASGNAIALGAAAPRLDTPAGERLLAHEIGHIALGHPGVRREILPGGGTSRPTVGNFVLDPALANVQPPTDMRINVKVRSPSLGGGAPAEYHVVLDRQVLSAERIEVFLTPADWVYESQQEAQLHPPVSRATPMPGHLVDPRAPAFTASGPIQVVEQHGNHVVTSAANAETSAAGVVVLVHTDGGTVLLDAGLQCLEPNDAASVGEVMGRRLSALVGTEPVAEAVLAPGAPSGHLLPYLAAQIGIASLRGSEEQQRDGSLNAVLAAQQRYRKWYLDGLRDNLQSQRDNWERGQALLPTQDARDQRWNAHLQAVLAADPVAAGTTVGIAGNSGSAANPVVDSPSRTEALPTPDASGTFDLTGSAWEPDPNAGQIIVIGDGRLTTFPSTGFMLRPAAAPLHAPVEGLHAAGPLGATPAAPRPVTPWLTLPAIGKEGLSMARLDVGLCILVDAGGQPRAMPMNAVAQMQTQLGVSSIQRVLMTHVHADHVRNLLEIVKTYRIPAANLTTSSAWLQAPGLQALRTTTDPDLTALGYGAAWTPTEAVGGSGVRHTRVGSGAGQVDVFARAAAHQDLSSAYSARAAGTRSSVPSHMEDSAGFVYVHGNESSTARHAVFADFRGEDITDLLSNPDGATALHNVRVVSGLGHHLSKAAGQTPGDIEGLNLLLQHTVHRNGELTLLIQSNESFSFDGPATRSGAEGALLHYLQRQGVRVVFAGTAGSSGPDIARVDSNRGVTAPPSSGGEGVQVFNPDPQIQDVHRRLNLLREALRTVKESPAFGPQALEQPGQNASQLQTDLSAEITRLEGLLTELRGVAAADLLDARGPHPSGGRDYTSAANRAAFRARMAPSGRSDAAILADMARVQPVEAALTPAVRTRLQLALDHGRAISLATAFVAMPRELTSAAEGLPAAQRDALGRQYRELGELTQALESGQVPFERRVEVLAKATALRDQLRQWQASASEAQRPAIGGELARVEGIVNTLHAQARVDVLTGRDPQGRLTRTEFIRMGATAPAGADAAVRGFHAVGQAMGAVMVVHSVQEAVSAAAHATDGNTPALETLLRESHAAYGMHIGVRMATASLRQAAAGSGQVATWEFAVMAVLEVGATAAAHYNSAEERNAAIASSGIHATVNLLCMMLGQRIMLAGAAMPAHPLAKAGVMGLGLAITMGGETILNQTGLDAAVERWASYPPGSVTEVNQNIGRVLDDYRALIGTRRLQARSDEELRALGVTDLTAFRQAARNDAATLRGQLDAKERDLTGLFESAYADARGAWVGLPLLDQQAAQFTRLRAEARGTATDSDPGRADLDRRWRALDARLGLQNASAADIEQLAQWATLDEELGIVERGLNASPIDHAELNTHLERVKLTLQNARYRLDPASQGSARQTPLLPAGSPGHARYLALLQERERRSGRLQAALLRQAGHALPATIDSADLTPRGIYTRLLAVRSAYDSSVAEATAQHPELARQATQSDLVALTRAVEDANTAHLELFNRLRLAEAALQAAAHQALAAPAQTAPPTTSAAASPADPAAADLNRQLETEAHSAFQAMEDRRNRYGLVFRSEIDALVQQRGAQADRLLAANIDSRGNAPNASTTLPFSEEEISALHQGDLAGPGSHLSSTAHQLAEHRRIVAPFRSIDEAPKLDDLDRLHRSQVGHTLARVRNPYRYHSDNYFNAYPETRYAASLDPIVALIRSDQHLGTNGTFGGPAWYASVVPINADAVQAFGAGQKEIRWFDLIPVRAEELERGSSTAR